MVLDPRSGLDAAGYIDGKRPDQLLDVLRKRLLVVDDGLEDLEYYSAVLKHQENEVRSIAQILNEDQTELIATFSTELDH